jgi:endonuclease YncB( thermonuclease family)
MILLNVAAGLSLAAAAPLTGVALATDGDTILIRDIRIRLEGIDAPETDQFCLDDRAKRFPCGLQALKSASLDHR